MEARTVQADFEVGHRIGSYELLERVDALGFGVAFKAWNTEACRIEMIRVLPLDLSNGLSARRFLREANILLSLDHPNIVKLYRADQLDGRMVLTTELLEGSTLDKVLSDGLLNLKDGLRYILGVLDGLAFAHAKSVVHRCVAPANIHLVPDGWVKINGFAFARGENDPRLTSKGFVIGIAGYISPEQAAGSKLDARSDLYSIAAILYEIVTGRRPFESENYFQLMKAHLHDSATAPKEIRPEISEKLNRIILKGLDKDPGRRFPTADDLLMELREVQDALGRDAA
jgi:serine/threonine-protein kinase